jgi:hypothetical protein
VSPSDRAALDQRLAEALAAALVREIKHEQAVITAGSVSRPPASEKAVIVTGEKRTAA